MKAINISELIESDEASLQTGPFGTQLKAKDYVESGTPVINVKNVGFGTIRHAGLEYVNDKMKEKLSAHILQKGDIVFGRKGAVERHAFIYDHGDGWIQGSDCLRLRINSNRVNNRFVSYYFRTQAHQDWMQALCSFGATMASLNQDIVKRISLPLPAIQTQNKIAAILTSYDDLIEANNRRIQLLEKMAEEVYKEWFVRLRFPDHQKTKFVKGVPEGWEQKHVKDSFDFLGGGTPSKSNNQYWSSAGVNWFTPTDITARKGAFLSESSLKCNENGIKGSSAKMFPAYSLMMTSRATIGEVAINKIEASTNQGFITCIPNDDFPLSFLYFWLKLSKEYFLTLCGGSTFPELSKSHFGKISILKPPPSIMNLYTEQADSLFEQLDSLLKTNQNLAETRDKLLPRLISGKLSVENLDINFPPSMEDALA